MRIELLTEYRRWVKENCDCKGRQKANLSKRKSEGLKSLQKRIKDGDLVVLPTDKSGRFAIMSMETYMLAGEVHTGRDEEFGTDE